MNGTIVSAVRSAGAITAAVRVNEGPPQGTVEYVATVPTADPQGVPYATSDIRAALIRAWSTQRAAAQQAAVDVSSLISGQVTL
jgi:hypothetical protein